MRPLTLDQQDALAREARTRTELEYWFRQAELMVNDYQGHLEAMRGPVDEKTQRVRALAMKLAEVRRENFRLHA